jgi:hypothetical protein
MSDELGDLSGCRVAVVAVIPMDFAEYGLAEFQGIQLQELVAIVCIGESRLSLAEIGA